MIDVEERLAAFRRRRVLLVGDTIVDVYTHGEAIGLAAESPTIVARRTAVTRTLGGAAFVCRNLLALGARVDFVTLAGGDAEAVEVAAFAAPKLDLAAIVDPDRPTTVKQRFWVDGYKLLQLDVRDDRPVSDAVAAQVMDAFRARLAGADAVLIADYRHGLITRPMAGALVAAATAAGRPVYVDSQVAQNAGNHTWYRPGAIVCLNLREARSVDPGFEPSEAAASFERLQAALEARAIVVKLGGAGAVLFDGTRVWRAAARPATVADPTGAGDAFLAALALAGLDDPAAALILANAWAGLSVEIHGTTPPLTEDLAAAFGARRAPGV